jgi:acyl-coenzyme A synthetase/AMP-(fatty) acid ligase
MSKQPAKWIPHYSDHSIMIVNPDSPQDRIKYLLDKSDYSVLQTDTGEQYRKEGLDYPGEKLLWYTSGTTGDSKFYGFSQEQLDHLTKTICEAYNFNSNDRYYSVMPLWHAHGAGLYWATLRAGCECEFGHIQNRAAIERLQPTFASGIPDLIRVVGRMDLKNLRFLRTSSVAMPDRLYRELKDKFGIPIIEAFGITEALSHCFTNPLDGEHRLGTIGLPSGINARVTEQGHLEISGPAVFRAGWFDTGDLAELDERGYFRILGRSRDQISVRGIKIDPLSIENQMMNRFEQLVSVAVFGEDRLKCLYVGPVAVEDVRAWLSGLGAHFQPAVVESVDVIPVNNTGKVSRSMLNTIYL